MECILAPSILSADFARLGDQCQQVLDAGAHWIHLDVMDNHYVPNLTMGPMVCAALRQYGITAPIDVHLMVSPVDALVVEFAKAGATWITFHPDASIHVDRTLQLIRELGCKSGLVLNPHTPIQYLDYVWDKLDMVVVMSVNPGFGGQAFIPSVIKKINALRTYIDHHQLPVRIEIDGGVTCTNVNEIVTAGIDTVVAGSAIFGAPDISKRVKEFRIQMGL